MATEPRSERDGQPRVQPAIDTPQPGAKPEMPFSPPATKFIVGALIIIGLLAIAALASVLF